MKCTKVVILVSKMLGKMTIILSLLFTVSLIHAQDTLPESQNPSTQDEAEVAQAETVVEPDERALPQSYGQADLTRIVGNVQRPNGMVYFENNLFAVCTGDWTLYRIQAETGSTITYVTGIRNAHSMYIEETNTGFNLFTPDYDLNRLTLVDERRFSPRTIASENLDGPWGIITNDDGSFLISNIRSGALTHVTRSGETGIVMDGFISPTGLARDTEHVYVANNGSARRAIEWFALDDLTISEQENGADEPATVTFAGEVRPLVSGLQNVSNLVLAEDGYLYFTYALGTRGVVGRVNPNTCRDGACTNADVEIVVYTELPAPLSGLTITPDMRLYVLAIFSPELYYVDLYRDS